MDTQHLNLDEELRLNELVLHSVRSRYGGELERWDDVRDGSVGYTPLDDDIRDLLNALWDTYLTPDKLDGFERRLREDGVDREDWGPQAWCEEDIEDEAEQRARELDAEEAQIDDEQERIDAARAALDARQAKLDAEQAKLSTNYARLRGEQDSF
jgi:hypothetical protein